MIKHRLFALILLFIILSHSSGQDTGPGLLFIGHRGASHLAPENTLASITLAFELGADAAECDIMLSEDNKVILFHDKDTRRLTGASHVVENTPWETLSKLTILSGDSHRPEYRNEPIPLLEEVLPAVPAGRMLVIEIKTGRKILPYLEKVLDSSPCPGKISFIAFDFETIVALKARYPSVPCYYLAMFKKDVNRHFEAAVEAGLDGLDLRYGIVDREMVVRCRKAGLELWCWTVNDPATARVMQALGVSAVTTDRPAWLREHLAADPENN
jgi:glycerophosphoryl diester phosphodiesterase